MCIHGWDWIGLDWLDWIGLEWIGWAWVGLERIGLDRIAEAALDRMGLDRIGAVAGQGAEQEQNRRRTSGPEPVWDKGRRRRSRSTALFAHIGPHQH